MSFYAAEPVPSNLPPELAEYLNRQLVLIASAIASAGGSTMQVVYKVPDESLPKVPGALVCVNQDPTQDGVNMAKNGIWACMYDYQGDLVWKRLLPESN